MNTKRNNYLARGRTLAVALMLAALFAFTVPQISHAGTAVNATIVNVVKVDYKDASGTTSFTKSATATVTVTLLAAAPTVGSPSPASGQTVDSGAVQTYALQLYANANGPDTYDLALANGTTADSNYSSRDKYVDSITGPDGTVTNYGSGNTTVNNISVGATVILSDNNNNVVSVPAGTLNNIASGDFVIINGTKYKASATTAGTAASYNSDTHSVNAETNATITLMVETVPGNNNWTAAADFGAVNLAGQVISELYTVNVKITAVADALAPADADIYFKLTLTADGTGNPSSNQDNVKTTFRRSNVTISKSRSSATGKPGDIIEYTVEVAVTGAQATEVVVTDSVPVYTTLVSYSDSYGGTQVTGSLSTYFGWIGDGTNTDDTISAAIDGETSNNLGSGNATAYTASGTLKFYLGSGSNGTTGGTIAAAKTYTIKYKVKID